MEMKVKLKMDVGCNFNLNILSAVSLERSVVKSRLQVALKSAFGRKMFQTSACANLPCLSSSTKPEQEIS